MQGSNQFGQAGDKWAVPGRALGFLALLSPALAQARALWIGDFPVVRAGLVSAPLPLTLCAGHATSRGTTAQFQMGMVLALPVR